MLIAQAVFLLESGQTDRQTGRRDWTPAAIQPAWVIRSVQKNKQMQQTDSRKTCLCRHCQVVKA